MGASAGQTGDIQILLGSVDVAIVDADYNTCGAHFISLHQHLPHPQTPVKFGCHWFAQLMKSSDRTRAYDSFQVGHDQTQA